MIEALLLIFKPVPAWERIAVAQRKWAPVLMWFLLPLLLLGCAAEGWGLARWGKPRGAMAHVTPLSIPHAVVFEIFQLIASLTVVWIGAKLIKALGDTFHGRHSFDQTFTVAAYGLSPLFLLRLLNAFPSVSPWVAWGIGIALSAAILYHGLPRVMLPDPPHAFGLYLMSVVLLVMITGLACFLTTWYIEGRFTRLDTILSRFVPS